MILDRDYDEKIIGVGMKYVFTGAPDSFTDQLIQVSRQHLLRIASSPPLACLKLAEEDEFSSVVSLEKYHKFSSKFPATYMVAQDAKTESDMFGRQFRQRF